eukprot:9490790-Pyramimonas_sp.AAC.1
MQPEKHYPYNSVSESIRLNWRNCFMRASSKVSQSTADLGVHRSAAIAKMVRAMTNDYKHRDRWQACRSSCISTKRHRREA